MRQATDDERTAFLEWMGKNDDITWTKLRFDPSWTLQVSAEPINWTMRVTSHNVYTIDERQMVHIQPATNIAPVPYLKIYVVGFLISNEDVLLIEKARPDWQRGKLNGIGGHIELGEEPVNAMRREFAEETGLTETFGWTEFCVLGDDVNWRVHFFVACPDYDARMLALRCQSDEPCRWYDCDAYRLSRLPVIPNLKWLIPMALAGPTGANGETYWPYYVKESSR